MIQIRIGILLLLLLFVHEASSQRDDIVLQKEKKAYSQKAVIDLKNGVLVLRLKTNHRKIAILEQNAKSTRLSQKQRDRYKRILDGTIQRRDQFNSALIRAVMDSFSFCQVQVIFDTSTTSLRNGLRQGIFLGKDMKIDPMQSIDPQTPVFLLNFQENNSQFPFDILLIQRLSEKLIEPFPYFVEVRESWINDVNTPGAVRAAARLDRKLWKYYERVTQ